MTFQLSLLLYIYLAFLVLWLIFFLIGLYHMLKFGFKNYTTFLTTFIFIVVALVMLSVSFGYVMQIDWQSEVSIFGSVSEIDLPLY